MTVIVMMGVSGSGKTTIAKGIAEREGWKLVEGDAFHPPANIAKMKAGTPLNDADRLPWLHAIAAEIDRLRAQGESAVVACSALKRVYRDILIGARSDVVLVYLQGSRALIAGRLAARKGHFMPSSLLDSQFAALEEPGPDERPVTVSIDADPDTVVQNVFDRLRERLP
ncbi:MAG TPA: gluconokinase [Acetobacteraceae bacterium]|nr:gluconokinase [Acetobacteraceae bacterium]